jgi:hypothetical protein
MEKDNIIEIENTLLSGGASRDSIDEAIKALSDMEKRQETVTDEKKISTEEIKIKIMYETDWRKKAALSALLISKSLSE